MKKLELQDLQKIELEILIKFDLFCKANGLKYSLAAGTMIGAVRHQGFIPWDDDIDIFMMRDEYDKFCGLANEGKQIDSDISIINPCSENNFYPFLKIVRTDTILYEKLRKKEDAIGVWIDVFPIDSCGNTYEQAYNNSLKMQKYARKLVMYHLVYPNNSFVHVIKNIYVKMINVFGRKQLKNIIHYFHSYKGFEGNAYMGTLIWASCDRDFYPKNFFDEYTTITFENKEFMVFKMYDEILTRRYGNYMELPAEEDRVSHDVDAYLLN